MRDTNPRHAAARPSGTGRAARWHVITVLSIVVAVGTLAISADVLIRGRDNAWSRAERSSNNLILALERDITRNIRLIDLSLRGVLEAMAEPGFAAASPELRQRALFARAAGAEELGSVVVLDLYGTVIQDSTSVSPHRLNLADRDYFREHMDRADAGLYISRPFRSRLGTRDLSIAVSRRLPDKDGEFAGVVVGALRLEYLHRLFENLDIGRKGSITLIRSDGRLLARHPFEDADVDRDLSEMETFTRFKAATMGSFISRSVMDGTKRLYTFRHIDGLPLLLAVNIAADDVLGSWTHRSLVIGSLLALLCLATVTLSVLFRREMLCREAAEHALRASADQLAQLAATDALTGLTNRRGFETAMHLEWRRAARAETPVALLMIDADGFKAYNDRYGHPAGDQVLRILATCIANSVRRPGDCAARYGGEEFTALLPDTSEPDALAVAEAIRVAVANLDIPHAASARGRVTVSIGLAVAWPSNAVTETTLISAADAALYGAKRDGRDRVRVAGPAPFPANPAVGQTLVLQSS